MNCQPWMNGMGKLTFFGIYMSSHKKYFFSSHIMILYSGPEYLHASYELTHSRARGAVNLWNVNHFQFLPGEQLSYKEIRSPHIANVSHLNCVW